jgi:hypothetical protein
MYAISDMFVFVQIIHNKYMKLEHAWCDLTMK